MIYNINMDKLFKKLINTLIIISFLLLFSSCGQRTKTITLTDIAVDVPEDFKVGFLDGTVAIDNTVEFNESYGVERNTAIYTVVYTKYKPIYNGTITLEKARNDIVNGLRNNQFIKEFEIVNEGLVEGSSNSYKILLSFYYGPNKTYHKSFSMVHENGLLQIICMYNANSKKDDKEIENIIKSVRILDSSNTNN
ncbi:hypothetical protein BHAMNSH16_12185 [Brachyspira hampsonii]|uniref:Uncharacterized protein n=2 Tax=Brachyspira hampsonii TaxID=1287055 RepID=A0AAC9TVK8_9SPIR|nr:hypothetical protein BHAMNSH16_12185 [Brachyspira hampsonii]OEJ19215.1 hypothetical protein A9496_04880 [Brachyspira hampsonii]